MWNRVLTAHFHLLQSGNHAKHTSENKEEKEEGCGKRRVSRIHMRAVDQKSKELTTKQTLKLTKEPGLGDLSQIISQCTCLRGGQTPFYAFRGRAEKGKKC